MSFYNPTILDLISIFYVKQYLVVAAWQHGSGLHAHINSNITGFVSGLNRVILTSMQVMV